MFWCKRIIDKMIFISYTIAIKNIKCKKLRKGIVKILEGVENRV